MGCEQQRVGWGGSRGSDGGGGGGVQETVKLEYTSWWGTKGCSRGGIIFGNHLQHRPNGCRCGEALW